MLNLVNIGGSGGGTDEILKARSSLKIRFAAASLRMFPADGEGVWVKVTTGQKAESGAVHFEITFKLLKLD